MLLVPLAHGVGLLFLLVRAIILFSVGIGTLALLAVWLYLYTKDQGSKRDPDTTRVTTTHWVWESLETKRATAFIVAGLLLVSFVMLRNIVVFIDTGVPEALIYTFRPAGFVVAFVGLFGLYPTLAPRTPWLARVGVAWAVLPAVGWLVLAVAYSSVVTGLLQLVGEPPLMEGLYTLTALLSVPAYVLFGLASGRSGSHKELVSLLLLTVPLLVLVMAVWAGGGVPFMWGFLVGGLGLAHLALGIVIRFGGIPTGHAESSTDSTA